MQPRGNRRPAAVVPAGGGVGPGGVTGVGAVGPGLGVGVGGGGPGGVGGGSGGCGGWSGQSRVVVMDAWSRTVVRFAVAVAVAVLVTVDGVQSLGGAAVLWEH